LLSLYLPYLYPVTIANQENLADFLFLKNKIPGQVISMVDNMKESFLITKSWNKVKGRMKKESSI